MNNCGIYKIVNLVNGNIYVGSSENIKKRWWTHKRLLENKIHINQHLQRAWNLYGKDNFEFSIIEECEKEFLVEHEQYYLDIMKPKYNICKIANSTEGIKSSMETRNRISTALKGNKYALGCKHSNETRIKESIARIGNKNAIGNTNHLGYKHSAESRAKMSAAGMGKIISQEQRMKISAALMGNTNRHSGSKNV